MRTARWPAAPMAMTRITRTQIECGFKAPYGPIGRSGKRGKTTSVAPAKIRASLSSSSVIAKRTKRWRGNRAASTQATVTARPAASAGFCIDSPPSNVVTIKAISVVSPGSSSLPTPIADPSQKDDTRSRNCKQHLAADDEADRASKRRDRECTDARW